MIHLTLKKEKQIMDRSSANTNLMFYFHLQHLRQVGVVGKFVEFFGPGVTQLSIADRATIANMCPEYGATIGFFPVDEKSLMYLRQTGDNTVVIIHFKTNNYYHFASAEKVSCFCAVCRDCEILERHHRKRCFDSSFSYKLVTDMLYGKN